MVNWDWSQAAQGAGGGALGGSAFGPLGTGIGALAGGLLGGFGSGGNPYDKQMQAFANQGPLQRGAAAQGQLSQFRGNQAHLIAALEAQSRGEGPSLAAQQLQAATDRNSKQSQALAAGAAGPNAALAQFQAQQGNQALGAQAAQDAAMARIQEQYNAQNQLGLTLHGARGMDESMSQYNAGARNSRDSDNLNAGMMGRWQNLQALSTMWGAEAGKPGLGEQILGAGAGLYGFHAGQQGNSPSPQQMPAPAPGGGGYNPMQWGSGGGGGGGGYNPAQWGSQTPLTPGTNPTNLWTGGSPSGDGWWNAGGR